MRLEVTEAAIEIINILAAAGWSDDEMLDYIATPHPEYDRAYEAGQVRDHGEVRITDMPRPGD
jgi:hypothetical protein